VAGGWPAALLRAARPRQWVKNVLVLAAPLADGTLLHGPVLRHVLVAFVTFCLASSAGYLVNDVIDVDADRHHPTKRLRPIASGALGITTALVAAGVLAILALVLGWVLAGPHLALVLGIYLVVTVGYSLGIKHQPVFDLAVVAAGFLLRAIAGGAATNIPLSQWFLLVASFGSLFMVAGKRYAELLAAEATGAQARRSVTLYSASYLRFVWSVSATATIFAYALWSFDVGATSGAVSWAQVSVAPFALAILRYAVDVDSGSAGAPEDVVLRDRGLQVIALAWLVTFALAANVV
jgi:decaprenyl-phosphate phosphoribosyltransferase